MIWSTPAPSMTSPQRNRVMPFWPGFPYPRQSPMCFGAGAGPPRLAWRGGRGSASAPHASKAPSRHSGLRSRSAERTVKMLERRSGLDHPQPSKLRAEPHREIAPRSEWRSFPSVRADGSAHGTTCPKAAAHRRGRPRVPSPQTAPGSLKSNMCSKGTTWETALRMSGDCSTAAPNSQTKEAGSATAIVATL